MKLSISQIKSIIKASGYEWEAGTTSVSKLSEENQNIRLGLEVPPHEKNRVAMALARETATFAHDTKCDWRDKDNHNWITEVRDQGACGSCVSFGTVAVIEAQARIQLDDPDFEIDLSEADLFFCGAGRRCTQGWWPTNALDYARDEGIADEDCFEYQDNNMDCEVCNDKPKRLVQIGAWQEIINVDQRKEWLDKNGPLVACMAVYRDFFSYKGGVYRHVTGDLAGYHAVACVGYDDDGGYWICKNSWNEDWGEKGFFCVAYGEAEMDTNFAMYGVEKLSGPLVSETEEDTGEKHGIAEQIVIDCEFSPDQRVLWARVGGEWLSRRVTDTELAGLGEFLVGASTVEVYFNDGEIMRVRGWKEFA